MPRIRYPLGSRPNVNAVAAPLESEKPDTKPKTTTESKHTATKTNGRKRKSTEAEAPLTPGSASSPAAPSRETSRKKRKTAPAHSTQLLDVSDIQYECEFDEELPVYDTCDMVRRKIRDFLAKHPEIKQKVFLRAIVTAAYGEDSDETISSASFNYFLKQKGPRTCNTTMTYYAAYVFFEKLREKLNKPKSNDREMMEDIWPGGMERNEPYRKNTVYVVSAQTSDLTMDKYGRIRSWT